LAHEVIKHRFSCGLAATLKVIDSINVAVKALGGILLCAMSIAVFVSVASRYLSNITLTWIEEAATFGMAWLCALGAGLATRKGDMTAVTLGIMWLPPKVQKLCRIVSCVISLVLFVFIVDAGIRMAIVARLQRAPSIPQLQMFWVYLAMPVGMVIMFFNTTIRMIEIYLEKEGVK
jgi:TRAP-type C4-dicarboxylate transport system permease small subunit